MDDLTEGAFYCSVQYSQHHEDRTGSLKEVLHWAVVEKAADLVHCWDREKRAFYLLTEQDISALLEPEGS